MKKQTLILISAVIIAIGFFLLARHSNSHSGTLFETQELTLEADEADKMVDAVTEEKEPALQGRVFVDVQGEVMNPGVFEVDAHVRIGYLIELAGGLTDDANVRGLNQAARIYDEMVIFVPHVDDVIEMVVETNNSNESRDHLDTSGLISLSTASALELQSLPGIGPVLSENIIAHRETNGPFATVDELIRVNGIGAGTMENIREFVQP